MSEEKRVPVDGEMLKRYAVRFQGALEAVANVDTAVEAWDAYQKFEQTIRPLIDRDRKWQYVIRDGRKEISIADLARAAGLG
jgi:hypothetical protein